jgi:hypothetical protein
MFSLLSLTAIWATRPLDTTPPLTTRQLAELLDITPREVRKLGRDFLAQWGFKITLQKRAKKTPAKPGLSVS